MTHFITLHYKGEYMSKFYADNPSDVLELGNNLLIEGLRQGRNLPEMKRLMWIWADTFYNKRTTRTKCRSEDHTLFCGAFLGLMKLGVICEDDKNGFICTKKKSKKRKNGFDLSRQV